jgi:hypothetical protein
MPRGRKKGSTNKGKSSKPEVVEVKSNNKSALGGRIAGVTDHTEILPGKVE